MRFTPEQTTWVLVPARKPKLIEVPAGTTFASPGADYVTFVVRSEALEALAECPSPYPSWTLSHEKMEYVPPVPEPTQGAWHWNEPGGSWVADSET